MRIGASSSRYLVETQWDSRKCVRTMPQKEQKMFEDSPGRMLVSQEQRRAQRTERRRQRELAGERASQSNSCATIVLAPLRVGGDEYCAGAREARTNTARSILRVRVGEPDSKVRTCAIHIKAKMT